MGLVNIRKRVIAGTVFGGVLVVLLLSACSLDGPVSELRKRASGTGGLGAGGSGDGGNNPGGLNAHEMVIFIAAGNGHSLAIKKDGSLWAWGNNIDGQMGDGTSSAGSNSNPKRIGSDIDWALVAAGGSHSLAIKDDGSLWVWGNNYLYGQLGDGTNIGKKAPFKI